MGAFLLGFQTWIPSGLGCSRRHTSPIIGSASLSGGTHGCPVLCWAAAGFASPHPLQLSASSPHSSQVVAPVPTDLPLPSSGADLEAPAIAWDVGPGGSPEGPRDISRSPAGGSVPAQGHCRGLGRPGQTLPCLGHRSPRRAGQPRGRGAVAGGRGGGSLPHSALLPCTASWQPLPRSLRPPPRSAAGDRRGSAAFLGMIPPHRLLGPSRRLFLWLYLRCL